jgi:DNA-binding NarL/FixJ family response regulator
LGLLSRRGHVDHLVLALRAAPTLDSVLRSFPIGTRAIAIVEGTRRDARQQLLTPREREVLNFIREGLTNREIAKTLFISESTAKVHVRHILEKLGVRSRTEAAILGARLEL